MHLSKAFEVKYNEEQYSMNRWEELLLLYDATMCLEYSSQVGA